MVGIDGTESSGLTCLATSFECSGAPYVRYMGWEPYWPASMYEVWNTASTNIGTIAGSRGLQVPFVPHY